MVNGMVAEDSCYPEEIQSLLPKLQRSDYFIYPRLQQLASSEVDEPGYCSRVTDFVVGSKDHGFVKFSGETDVRWLNLDSIVRFGHREIVVYENEETKPPVGSGLNKPAEVTLYNIGTRRGVNTKCLKAEDSESFVGRLKRKNEQQGADFISYDATKLEWKFYVHHFSRFGLDDSDDDEPAQPDQKALSSMEDDVILRDSSPTDIVKSTESPVWHLERSDAASDDIEEEGSPMQDVHYSTPQSALAHSLPQHLRLDPLKMQQMKMLFFPSGEENDSTPFPGKSSFQSGQRSTSQLAKQSIVAQSSPGQKKNRFSPVEESPQPVTFSKHIMKVSPQPSWKRTPKQSLSPFGRQVDSEVEHQLSPLRPSRMLLSLEGKSEQSALKRSRSGFKNEIDQMSCMFGRSDNIVDAALFLGCSFRVGWGPHGLLAHSGNPVGQQGNAISSMISIEHVAFDGCVRDEEGKVREDLVELQYVSPLKFHMSMSKIVDGMDEKPSKIKLRYVHCDRTELPYICNNFEDLLVKQHSSEGVSASQRLVLRHQVMAWNLVTVLFSEKVSVKDIQEEESEEDDDDVVDQEVAGLVRRAEFSCWLQDSVRHLIDEELMNIDATDQLKVLFSLLTGRQLDEGVQLAVARGDVRLACLVSQAGGSVITRSDIASQLEIWEDEGFDFDLVEGDMVLIYRLISGDIQGALEDRTIDWKRFLGLLMWYNLGPDTQLAEIIRTYSLLVEDNSAPQPTPMYVEEGASEGMSSVHKAGLYDTIYYLMLLLANQEKDLDGSKMPSSSICRMFSSSASTYDPLDHRMAWLQHGILEAIAVLPPIQLHVLDMNFASQLLSVGQCHWAIYVVLHMPPDRDYPGLHEKVIKEILHQYCEVWSTTESQQIFLEKELGIPSEWLHEALGTYWQYKGDAHKAIKHLLKSNKWHWAHSLFMTSVAASLFISGQYEELLELATPLERNKIELDDWAISGGIYCDFFMLRSLFQNDGTTNELGSSESKAAECKSFFQRLKESQAIWGSRWEANNRVAYSRMAHELATLLLSNSKLTAPQNETTELKLHHSVLDAPLPEDLHFYQLQGAASAFTSWLVQAVSQ